MSNSISTENMNPKQRKALELVKSRVVHGREEIKRLELSECCGDVSVIIEVGLPDDEGTMAFYVCRDTYVFWIGRRGGVYQYKRAANGMYRREYRKHGFVERQKY